MKHLVLIVAFSGLVSAQPWSGIIATSRAIDWSHAGLPPIFPDGETTPNPWTPPTRPNCTSAQAGITVPLASGTPFTGSNSIASAMFNCSQANPHGSVLLLGNGTFTNPTFFYFVGSASGPINNVTLRGANGPQNTTINLTGGALQFGGAFGNSFHALVSGSPSQGATSVTITGPTGTLTVGQIAWFGQCDTGWSPNGSGGCTGTWSDNGGVFVCSASTICNSNGTASGNAGGNSQEQMVLITSVSGNNIGFTSCPGNPTPCGLYAANWSSSQGMFLNWETQSDFGIGDGIEDVTFTMNGGVIATDQAYASWFKGDIFINSANPLVQVGSLSKNFLISNSYFYCATPIPLATQTACIFTQDTSDNLYINNIMDQAEIEQHGMNAGDVMAYNYTTGNSGSSSSPYYQSIEFQHDSNGAGIHMYLDEGNISNALEYDDTWGTHNLSTAFRNWYSCGADGISNFIVNPSNTSKALHYGNFSRFMNAVGNVLGGQTPTTCPNYTGAQGSVVETSSDNLTNISLLLWGNYDTNHNVQRFAGSCAGGLNNNGNTCEVPTNLSGNATPYNNAVPATQTLPVSFLMPSMTSHPTGGTGLSYWKVCTAWSAFPTSCSTTATPPMPPVHPESTGGQFVSGHADRIPALIAFMSLPVNPSLQNSYTITSSSWAGGVETLNFSGGTPYNSIAGFMGAFSFSGVNASCSVGAALANGSILMTGSSPNSVTYVLPSNPGVQCTGTMKWPDVLQFDERVYQNDPSGPTILPTSFAWTLTQSPSASFVCSGTGCGSWSSTGTFPTTSGTPISINSSTGLLSGGPINQAGSFSVAVTSGSVGPQTVSIVVNTIVSGGNCGGGGASCPVGQIGSTYGPVTITWTNGTAPISCASSDLPVGITLNSACVLGGQPSNNGLFTFHVTPTDSNSIAGAAATFNVTFNLPPTCNLNQPIGNYLFCGSAYNNVSSGATVAVNYAPHTGNAIIAWSTACYTPTCTTSNATTMNIGDNVNATETCFAASPHSPFVTNANGGAQGAGDFQLHYVWYCPTIPAGVSSFTVTATSSMNSIQLGIHEFDPAALARSCSPLSACFEGVDNWIGAGNTTGGTTATITTAGPTVSPNDLIFSAILFPFNPSQMVSVGANYTGLLVMPGGNDIVTEALGTNNVGVQTATGTATIGSPWFGLIIPIKSSSAITPSGRILHRTVVF